MNDSKNPSQNDLNDQTFQPEALARLGEVALLRVVGIEPVGIFLEWGQPKDLFMPYSEQSYSLKVGQEVLVYVYLDQQDRPCASMKIESFLKKSAQGLQEEQPVHLIILAQTDLGYKAVINNQFIGVLYRDEVFQSLHYGQNMQGYIKKIRPDGKIDLKLAQSGHLSAQDISPKILEMLKEKNGFLDINEKTAPEVIYDMFGVSKKKYKIILGDLYKKRLIRIEADGIYLVK